MFYIRGWYQLRVTIPKTLTFLRSLPPSMPIVFWFPPSFINITIQEVDHKAQVQPWLEDCKFITFFIFFLFHYGLLQDIKYSCLKRNGFGLVELRQMNLQPIIQGEESQKEKNKYHVLMHIYGIQKNGTDEPISRSVIEMRPQKTDFWTQWRKESVG